jgi:hypothetical protein
LDSQSGDHGALQGHWLSFLGREQTPAQPIHPFVQFISGFAIFMRDERGLSLETINFRYREGVADGTAAG